MDNNLGYKKVNGFFKFIGIILLIIFAGSACYIGYVKLSEFVDKNDNHSATEIDDKVLKSIKEYENKGYKNINLNIDLTEDLKNSNGAMYSLIETKKINNSFKSDMLRIDLINDTMKLYDLSNNERKQVQELKNVKEINYYEDKKCSYVLFSYLITKDHKIYILNVENSVEGMKYEESSNELYKKIDLYVKKLNYYCAKNNFKLIGTNDENKLYDLYNKVEVEKESDIEEKSGYFDNRDVYVKGIKQDYKVKLLGIGRMEDVVLIVGNDNNLYDLDGNKINSKKISAIMVNEEEFKIVYIYEDGNVEFMEDVEIESKNV